MRFAIWPQTYQAWQDFFDAAQHAAASGWDGVYVADHFMRPRPPMDVPTLECFTVLGALATAVPGVRLGSLVAGNTYRHPAVLAKMISTLDHVSGGRAVLGLGAGWQENEHRAFGIELFGVRERLERLDEACAVVRHLLDEERTTFEGRHYTIVGAPLEPKPLQAHLPLLVGGGGERTTLRIVARWADEWNVWGTPPVVAAKAAVLARHCEAVGRDPGTIARSAQVLLDMTGTALPFGGPMPVVEGSVGELQELLARYADAGVSEFVLPDWNLGTGTHRRDAMDTFLHEVAAPFRGT